MRYQLKWNRKPEPK